jgi:GGDEF domain-containing protein
LADEISVVSLKRSLEEYEGRRLVVATYTRILRSTLESIKHYVVETDVAAVERFRKHIGQSLELLRSEDEAPSQEAAGQVAANVRGELRDYKDRATRYIDRLREDLAATALILDEIMQAAQESGAEDRMKAEIARMGAALSVSSLAELREKVRCGLDSLSECAEQLRREKDGVIAQLKDEIRTLHKAAEQSRSAAAVDPATGVHKRGEIERLMRRELAASRSVAVIHICLCNLNELNAAYPPALIEQLVIAFCRRMGKAVPRDAIMSSWRRDVFLILLPPAVARRVASEVLQACVGRYSVMDDGVSRTLHLQVMTTSLCSEQNEDADEFFQKLNKLGVQIPPRLE